MKPLDRPVSEYMTRPVVTVTVDDALEDADTLMRQREVTSLAVVGRDGTIAGLVSQNDLLQVGHVTARILGAQSAITLPSMCVGDLMTRKIVTIAPTDTITQAARAMAEHSFHRLYVADQHRPVGVLSVRDAMRAAFDARLDAPLSKFMRTPVPTVTLDDPLSEATRHLYEDQLGAVIVVDGGQPAGIVTHVEALAARDLPPEAPVADLVGYRLIQLHVDTPLHRAAAFAVATDARVVLAVDGRELAGVIMPLDFARAIASA